jgi:CRP-like cAMP-binding protein
VHHCVCWQTVGLTHPAQTARSAAPESVPLSLAENHLIARLSRRDQRHLLDQCESVPLELAQALFERGQAMHHVYFPTSGLLALVLAADGHAGLGVALVGREGMLGAHLALEGGPPPWSAVVLGPGAAWRMRAEAFRRERLRCLPLQRALNQHVAALMSQLAANAVCLSRHLIGRRLARWLLMSQDRIGSNQLRATHEVLADMLGVRRVGITMAAGALQRAGLIGYHRGALTVLDRPGLQAMACSCYAAPQTADAPEG